MTSEAATAIDVDKCLVCETVPKNNFSYILNICRSCRIFSQRSQQNKKIYQCRRNTFSCVVNANHSRRFCKACRLSKCIRMGMSLKKSSKTNKNNKNKSKKNENESENDIQEEISLTDDVNVPRIKNSKSAETFSIEAITGENIYINNNQMFSQTPNINLIQPSYTSSVIVKNNKSVLNLHEIIGEVKNLLTFQPVVSFDKSQSSTEYLNVFCTKLEKLLQTTRSSQTLINITNTLDQTKHHQFVVQSYHSLAVFLLETPAFNSLLPNDRLLLFNHLFPVFSIVERLITSLNTFGRLDRNIILYDDTQAMESTLAFPNEPELSNERKNQLYKIYQPVNKYLINCLYIPLKSMNLSTYEFSYLLAHRLWSCEDIPDLSKEALTLAKQNIIIINNNIHQYYTKCVNTQNYAFKLTEIVKSIQRASTYFNMKKKAEEDATSPQSCMQQTIAFNKQYFENLLASFL